MKSKKRHYSSSEDSDESNASGKSSSSSDSESEDSSVAEHRGKKKRKRADSSDSDSNSDNQKRSKKRKHKKKKKKHGKKKKRSDSADRGNIESLSSVSDGEITSKKKRKQKHKHSKRAESAQSEEAQQEHRLHSVVKECRQSSDEGSQPPRTYYQKDYPMRHPPSGDNYERQCEVQRFYRGSSKEHHSSYQESYGYDRGHNERVYDKGRERYNHNQNYGPNAEYNRRPKEFDEYKRHPRYEEHRPDEDFHRRPRDEPYQGRENSRGYNRFNNQQFENRGAPKQREVHDVREYRERRGPPDMERFRDREYVEKRDKYREERYPGDRNREFRRERPPRVEKPSSPHQREHSKSRSPERYRDQNIKVEGREDREGEREGRPVKERVEKRDSSRGGEERRERRRSEERPRPADTDSRPRERKTRFADADDKKEYGWGKTEVKKEGKPEEEKEKPNFGLSGKLTADANTVNGVVIKYAEPDDAKQPKRRWRFYPFKGDKALPILYIHRQSCFLIGRDKKVVDIALEHPSISKQHAALQYRATPFERPDGSQGRRVRPYVIDLESANGTFVNNKKISPRRYVELLERDVVKFGFSQREYVLLHENSKDDAQDDDNQEPAAVATTDHIKHEKRIKEEVAADGD